MFRVRINHKLAEGKDAMQRRTAAEEHKSGKKQKEAKES